MKTGNSRICGGRRGWWLAGVLAVGIGGSGAGEGPEQDTVVLRNGKRVTGQILTETVVLRTEGGEVRFPREAVERVEFARPPVGEGGEAAGASTPGAVAFDPTVMGWARDALVWIPPGEFVMGSPYDEPGRDRDESPQTRVVFREGFWMGRCEVTQEEYERLMGTNPSVNTSSGKHPVEKVSWFEAMEFCARLTRLAAAAGALPAGYGFRLPGEAEWEYACRAGTTTRFSFGDDPGDLDLMEYGWYVRNSDSSTHPVGKKRANPWGLHDLHGNVWEWCLDRWEGSLPGGVVTNRPVSVKGILRVARGGSWLYESRACRSANRDDYSPGNRCADLGFRVVLAPMAP